MASVASVAPDGRLTLVDRDGVLAIFISKRLRLCFDFTLKFVILHFTDYANGKD